MKVTTLKFLGRVYRFWGEVNKYFQILGRSQLWNASSFSDQLLPTSEELRRGRLYLLTKCCCYWWHCLIVLKTNKVVFTSNVIGLTAVQETMWLDTCICFLLLFAVVVFDIANAKNSVVGDLLIAIVICFVIVICFIINVDETWSTVNDNSVNEAAGDVSTVPCTWSSTMIFYHDIKW